MLLKPNSVNGFVKYMGNVEEKTISAYNTYFLIDKITRGMKYTLMAIVLLFPLIAYFIYLRFGKEKSYTVPEYLSYVPNKSRKPWIVNLIFNGDIGKFDENGFYATLLDLHNRGYIEIVRDMNGLKIKILNKDLTELDVYEKKVMKFLIKYSENDVFSPDEIESNCMDYEIAELWEDVNEVMKNPPYSSSLAKEFLETRGKDVLWISLAISIVLA